MASQVEIANLALSSLGASEISSLTEATKEAEYVSTFWDQALREVLQDHTWDFAKKWASLAEDSSYTMVDDEWDYAYQIPTDFIRPVRDDEGNKWERRREHILTNASPFNMEYIQDMNDESKYPTYFIVALYSRLRAFLSIPLKKKGTMVSGNKYTWYEVYELIDLPRARIKEAPESNKTAESKVKHTKDTDSWVVAGS